MTLNIHTHPGKGGTKQQADSMPTHHPPHRGPGWTQSHALLTLKGQGSAMPAEHTRGVKKLTHKRGGRKKKHSKFIFGQTASAGKTTA